MTKYASMILVLACATVGIGTADAQQGNIGTGHRVPTISAGYSAELPERPEMQTRDGDYSFCDDSDGGLMCGGSVCYESEYMGQSYCIENDSPENSSNP